jgi:hypothetical protein
VWASLSLTNHPSNESFFADNQPIRSFSNSIDKKEEGVSISICDFCSEPHVAWRYPAHSFVAYAVAGIVGQSVGDWAACAVCHALIEAGDRSALVERSLSRLLEKHPDMRPDEAELRNELALLHGMFFAHQTGAAAAALPVV